MGHDIAEWRHAAVRNEGVGVIHLAIFGEGLSQAPYLGLQLGIAAVEVVVYVAQVEVRGNVSGCFVNTRCHRAGGGEVEMVVVRAAVE